jgi:UDP-glucose:(heptosyl)LPS alpha-1,3-glucosyltransferase
MRIGVVIEHFIPRRGGAEQWTSQFVKCLIERGHEVHVVAQDFCLEGETLPIVAHPLGRVRGRLELAMAAEQALRRLSLDVVHDMGVGWYCDVFESHDGSRVAQWEQKLRTLPAWLRPWKRWAIRVLPRYREFGRLVARQFADRGQIVLALSRMVARDLEHYHAVRPEQIRLIYNGVDVERFSPERRPRYRDALRRQLAIRPDEVLFLFLGHDFRRKGLATAVQAVRRLSRQGQPVRLLVVGGKRSGRFGGVPTSAENRQPVVFVGSVPDPVPYYAAADAYVLPTYYDPCSLGVLEAAAAGLPSVTTRFNGAGELLTDGVDGFVLGDPADHEALAGRLSALLDADLRRRMGAAARQLALRHTLQRNSDEILAVYRERLSAGGAASSVRRSAA